MPVGYLTGEWNYADLPRNVVIGADCYLERQGSFELFRSERDTGVRLGNRVEVYTWTTFNVEPAGLVEVGDDSVLVGAVLMCADHIVIGRRVVISYQVTIADSDFHPRNAEERRRDARANAPFGDRSTRPHVEALPVRIGDDVRIGVGAIILKGVTIGAGALIGAGAVITSDVPEGGVMVGNPAQLQPGS